MINKIEIKNEIPVIALRNIALLPKIVTPLLVQREKTMSALTSALSQDKLALFVAQKNSDEDIKTDQLFKIGTVGKITRIVNGNILAKSLDKSSS